MAVGRGFSLEQCFPTSGCNTQGILISGALLMMPLKSASVSLSCIARMGCLNDSYRWRSSWFWYYNAYTPATCSSIWEMQHPKWVQMGNQKTELILLKALSKGQLQITQQFIVVELWHPVEQHFFQKSKARPYFYSVLKSISKKSLLMKWYMELGEHHTEANGWSARKVKEWTTSTN